MTHIFVSHATADDGIVSKLHDELEAATGLNMWVDHKDLKPPISNFRAALQEALKTCDAGLLVLSKNIIGRDEIDAEWNYILSTAKRPLYVAKVDDISPLDMNARLGLVQWVDLYANWEAGVRTLAAYMRGENPPADAPLVPMRKISGIEDRKLLYIPMSGRDKELQETLDKLKREPVMIVGVGGRGKSRLAAEAALRSTDTKGAVWHKVDDISSAEDVINGLREHFEMANDVTRKDVLGKLKQEKTLVVIDNAESAEDDARREDYCKLVETLLRAGGQVLLTGRAEWTGIEPLGVVRPEAISEVKTAVQILLDMGKVFESPYNLQNEAEGLAKAALMHPRLMEWAVKQTKREAPKDVLKQLQGLQSKDVQKALDEMIHKTLRQMTAATGDDQAEKLLRQLVVFRGAFTMEAAEAITGLNEDELRTARNNLQEWQFVTMQADGNEARYRVDGLVLEVLTSDEATRAAHFAYYNGLHGDHNTNNDETRHPLIERDWDNVRAALAWGFEHEAQAACDLATALNYYMQFRVSYEIRRETLSKAQQAAIKAGHILGKGQTLKYLADLDLNEGQYADSRANYDLALQAFRLIPDRLGEANILKALGELDLYEGRYRDARSHFDAALQSFRQIRSLPSQASTLRLLGELDFREGHYEDARSHFDAALQSFRQIRSLTGEANTLKALGELDFRQSRYTDARIHFNQAFATYQQIPSRLGEAGTMQLLGNLDQIEKLWSDAYSSYDQAIRLYQSLPDLYSEAITRRSMWPTLAALGRYEEAIKGILFAHDVFTQIGLPQWLPWIEGGMTDLRKQIGKRAFKKAWKGAMGDAPLPEWLE